MCDSIKVCTLIMLDMQMNIDNGENRKKKRPLFKRIRSFRKGRSSNGTEVPVSDGTLCDGSLSPPEAELNPGMYVHLQCV